MTNAFTEHKPRCPKCKTTVRVDRKNRLCCDRCGYIKVLGDKK